MRGGASPTSRRNVRFDPPPAAGYARAEKSSVTFLQRLCIASRQQPSPGPHPSRRLSRRYSQRSDWRFCFSMPTSSSTRSACTRLMSALVRVASAWLSFDLAATATFARSPEFWLVHRAWPLCQNSCAGQPRRRPASSRQRCARPTLQPHACAPRLRSGLVRLRCACFLLVVGRLVAFGFHVSIGLLPCLFRSGV